MSGSSHLYDKAGQHLAEVIPSEFGNPDSLKEGVHAHDGLMTVEMRTLRDWLSNYQRLRPGAVAELQNKLESMGFGWLPAGTLPRQQDARVCLYRLDGPIPTLLKALKDPAASADRVGLLQDVISYLQERQEESSKLRADR
jgi:hypothetical protein